MLDKRLTLGGLQVGGPRTAQNPARFRVANNVYQTRDDYMVPRADTEEYESGYVGATSVKNAFRYKDKPFVLGHDGSNHLPYYESTTKVPGTDLPDVYGSYGVQAVEKLGNLYLNFPSKGLWKYDGYQMYRAGTPLPWVAVLNPSISPAFYVRLIQHHVDQQGNVVSSGYDEYGMNYQSGTSIQVYTNKGASGSSRNALEVASLANGFLAHFIKVTGHTLVSGNTYILDTGGDHNVEEGVYLLWVVIGASVTIGGTPTGARGIAYKVLSQTATTVTVGEPRYIDENGEWQDIVDTQASHPANGDFLSHYWMTVWTSTTSTGNYVLQDVIPSLYESNNNQIFTVTFANANVQTSPGFEASAFNMGGNLGDVYDVISTKQVFPLTETQLPNCFSTYGDMALLAYDNEIYHSDMTLGGAFEMTNGLAFIVVGEGDDGNVQSICGTSSFMLVSRQYKNYYLAGNIPTANYRVTEVTGTSLGAYSNECSIANEDKIVFLNKQGVWALYYGGKCNELTEFNRGLFDNFASTASFAEEAYFDIDSYPTYASDSVEDFWIRPRLDVNRGLLAFVISDNGAGKALVLNLNNGEFYTWSDLIHSLAFPAFSDLCFIDGAFYVTQNADGVIALNVENKSDFAYLADLPARLSTTWFTGGEPSLEKKLQQVKVWGRVDSFEMEHALDWIETPIIDGTYTNAITDGFSHKKRFTPANFLAVSVDMAFTAFFQIEGVEIEWQPFQEGMKR